MDGSLQLCANCDQNVPSAHFILHEAHCLRVRTVCPECREVILKEQLEDHQANGHKQVPCSWCLQSMQQYLLEAHQAQCLERPIKCEFCELAPPLSQLEEHESRCGGRTGPCLGHEDSCTSGPSEARRGPGRRVGSPDSGPDAPQGKRWQQQEPLRRLPELESSFGACSVREAGEYDALEACAHCRVLLPRPVQRWHEEKCGLWLSRSGGPTGK